MRTSFFVSILIATTMNASAGSISKDCEAPAKIAEKYLQYDNQGETAHTSALVDAIVGYEDGDTPAWDAANLVKNAKMIDCKMETNKATFTFEYLVIGFITSGGQNGEYPVFEMFHPAKKDTQNLIVRKKGDQWKIDFRSVFQPHESIDVGLSQLNERLKSSKDPAIKKKIQEAIQAVKTASASASGV